MAEDAGLELGVRNHRYNGDLAHEAMQWARSVRADDAMHRAIFRAYFVNDRNIGSAEVLVDLAEGAGPTFVADGRALIGAHPYASFHQLMASAGVPRRALAP